MKLILLKTQYQLKVSNRIINVVQTCRYGVGNSMTCCETTKSTGNQSEHPAALWVWRMYYFLLVMSIYLLMYIKLGSQHSPPNSTQQLYGVAWAAFKKRCNIWLLSVYYAYVFNLSVSFSRSLSSSTFRMKPLTNEWWFGGAFGMSNMCFVALNCMQPHLESFLCTMTLM